MPKPDVKKARGVYYTPKYLVMHLVRSSLDSHANEFSIASLFSARTTAHSFRIIDPACGSGSFLVTAFEAICEKYVESFRNRTVSSSKKINDYVVHDKGLPKLTVLAKKAILTRHIFGVDIDPQATEVAKLNLLLKALEGETHETVNSQLKLFHNRALPDLDSNIKCGNTLLEPTDLQDPQLSIFGTEDRNKLNTFAFASEFPFFEPERFDLVIGNPPWVSAWTENLNLRKFVASRYALTGHWDTYLAFLTRALELVSDSGRVAFVLPTSFLTEPYAAAMRRNLLSNNRIREICEFGSERVFKKVSRKVCILSVSSPARASDQISVISWRAALIAERREMNANQFINSHNAMINLEMDESKESIATKILAQSIRVGNLFYVNYGAQISSKEKGKFKKEALISDKTGPGKKPLLTGSDVGRWMISPQNLFLDYKPSIMYGPRHPVSL